MIFDFNVAYSPKGYTDKDLMAPVSVGSRAAAAGTHLINIPARLLSAIIKLAKIILFSILSALAFGQSDFFNNGFIFASKQFVLDVGSASISTIGLFAPCNAIAWQGRLVNIYTETFKDTKGEPFAAGGTMALQAF